MGKPTTPRTFAMLRVRRASRLLRQCPISQIGYGMFHYEGRYFNTPLNYKGRLRVYIRVMGGKCQVGGVATWPSLVYDVTRVGTGNCG